MSLGQWRRSSFLTDRVDECSAAFGAGLVIGTVLELAVGRGVAGSAARRADDIVVIGKVDDLAAARLRRGERTLLDQLPDQGSPRLNYIQNARVLRTEMGRGMPIRDASVDPATGELWRNTGFLRAERDILRNHGWVFDSRTGYWYPPG